MFQFNSDLTDYITNATPKQRYTDNVNAIKLLNNLKTTGRLPSKSELITLAKFNGWGSCRSVFNINPDGWQKEAQAELQQLLGASEYSKAGESIINAHYTEPSIVKAVWFKITSLGFKSGRILEPSCGTGFFLGNAPKDVIDNSEIHAIELDPTPASIAKYLYPQAKIYNSGFEDVCLPDNYFDLIIGNVPFGDYKCPDPKYDWLSLSIHNYFFAKCSDLVRVGGLICLITSPFTMDASKGEKFRRWLGESQKLNLLAAIRLPAGVFKGVANTMVSPDILIFQKQKYVSDCNYESWVSLDEFSYYSYDWSEGRDSVHFLINKRFAKELNSRKSDKYYFYSLEENLIKTNNKIEFFKSVSAIKNIHPLFYKLLITEFTASLSSWDNGSYDYDKLYKQPHTLLGVPGVNELYGHGFALKSDGRDVVEGINDVIIDCEYIPVVHQSDTILVPPELQSVVKGQSYCVIENCVYKRNHSLLIPTNLEVNKVLDFDRLHSKLYQVINAQSFKSDLELSRLQDELLSEYKSFVNSYGKINSQLLINELGTDPRYYILRTLEKPDGTLADIFTKRIARNLIKSKDNITDIQDAIITCLNDKGSFDWQYTAKLMGVSKEQIAQQLEINNLGFYNPESDTWELNDHYLSGNVYKKLKIAEAHNLTRNIESLKRVQPTPMLPDAAEDIKLKCLEYLNINYSELTLDEQKKLLFKVIKVNLGATWIDALIYKKFAEEVLKIHSVSIKYARPPLSSWFVNHNSGDTTEYGTKHIDSGNLLELGLNGVDPKVSYKDRQGNVITDVEATEEARGKLNQIKQAFKEWIWQDLDRCLYLCKQYNTTINVYKRRKYDGSWLRLPGSNPNIKLLPHQLNAIAKGLEDPASFFAHEVGCGKTYVMIALAMECKRLGLVDKVILTVQNGTEHQTLQAWRELYPMANILATENFDADGRKLFTASFITGEFDGAIITHSQFFMMKMSDEYVIRFIEQEKAIYEDFLKNEKNSGVSKSIKKKIKAMESRIAKVKNSARKDDHIEFESLCFGGLLLMIDEIQMAKNLQVSTKKVNVRGINTSESQRALDTAMKLWYVSGVIDSHSKPTLTEIERKFISHIKELGYSADIQQILELELSYAPKQEYSKSVIDRFIKAAKEILDNAVSKDLLSYSNGVYKITDSEIERKGKIVGATGTILSNTMAEIFNWMRMFMFPTLQRLDLEHFDSWASQFGEVTAGAEITPSGQYKVVSRFKTFNNLSSLHGLLSQFCDIVNFDQINSHIVRPEGKFIDVISQPSEPQLRFLREALVRSELIRDKAVEPTEDNMLKVTTDLLKAALSMRLMGETKESPESKIHECIWTVWQIYNTTSSVKGTQLIFCDYSVPKNDRYNVYEYIKQALILLGIPEKTIQFIHNHNTATKRGKLFDLVNSGQVRILLGSTEKLGTGCNVHKNGLFALHHLDAPWTPKGLIQREGRGIRQGNGENTGITLKQCLVFRYITERLDALRWQTLQWKQATITKFLAGAIDINELIDEDEASYSYFQVKSLATGNPLLVEESNLRNELNSLLIQQRNHQQTQFGLTSEITRREKQINRLTTKIAQLTQDIETTKVRQSDLTNQSDISDKISGISGKTHICTYRGFQLYVTPESVDMSGKTKLTVELISDSGLNYGQYPIKVYGNSIEFRKTKPLESIDKVINALNDLLIRETEALQTAKIELQRAKSLVGKKFEHDGRILEIQHRLVDISEQMSAQELLIDTGTEKESDNTETVTSVETEDLSNNDCSVDPEIVELLKSKSDRPDWLIDLEDYINEINKLKVQIDAPVKPDTLKVQNNSLTQLKQEDTKSTRMTKTHSSSNYKKQNDLKIMIDRIDSLIKTSGKSEKLLLLKQKLMNDLNNV